MCIFRQLKFSSKNGGALHRSELCIVLGRRVTGHLIMPEMHLCLSFKYEAVLKALVKFGGERDLQSLLTKLNVVTIMGVR